MSSGLVASMALPANAAVTGPEANSPQTASIPAVPVGGSSAFFASPEGGLLALPTGLALDDGTVSAPAAATLDFDQTTFVAVPTPDVDAPQSPASRSGSSTDEDVEKPAAVPVAKKAPTTRREARQQQAATSTTTKTSTATTAKASTSSSSGSSGSSSSSSSATVASSGLGAQAVAIASRYLGIDYVYGGSKPSTGFDCSGLVQYVYAQLGKKLPRTADAQAAAVKIVPRSQARAGDLVLFPGRGHIGILVSPGMMIDAPHTGTVVQLRKIYSSGVSYGRVM